MATHDYVIANASGAAVRADLNGALAAIVSLNSNATEPATTYAHMLWYDETTNRLRQRNSTDDGWITIQDSDALTIDGQGKILVGLTSTSTPSTAIFQGYSAAATGPAWLFLQRGEGAADMSNNNNLGIISFADDDGNSFAEIKCQSDDTPGAGDYPGKLMFSTCENGASSLVEHVRIDDEGSLWVGNGTTGTIGTASSASNLGVFNVDVSNASTGAYLKTSRDTGAPNAIAQFWGNAGSAIIRGDGDLENTNNRYTGISDIKFKQNIEDASSQWDDIKNIRIRKYELIADPGRRQIGVVAQELEEVSPGLVIERVHDEDTGETAKSVAYSVLYMKAVKALQEAMERIETLEARVEALEAN